MTTQSTSQPIEEQPVQSEDDNLDTPFPFWMIAIMPFYILGIVSVFMFPFAGDWTWLYGWIFAITLSVNMTISMTIINYKNPRVLRNRTRMKKQGLTAKTKKSASTDWFVIPLLAIGMYGAMIVPALGVRFGWASLPLAVVIVGEIILHIGIVLINVAQSQNAFASKILDINKGQVLIDTGLYAKVRHPLYSGGVIMSLGLPIALGSLWALIPAFICALTLVIRIKFEEDMLLEGMEGYADYQKRVPYKLIPGVY